MKKLFLIALLSLTATTSFANSFACGTGEVRAFSKNALPDEETWMPADGRSLNVHENIELFSMLYNTYGGEGTDSFGIPKIDDLVVNGKKYPYYICIQGVYPADQDTVVSFITQYPDSSPYNVIEQTGLMINMNKSTKFSESEHVAYTALMPEELFQNNSVWVPKVVFPESVKNGPGKLRSFTALDGYFPMSDNLPGCERGGIYFTFSMRLVDSDANYREIIPSQPFADVMRDGQKLSIQPRIMECK